MSKVAIILHAEPGTHDAMGRAAHALLYTKELKERGHEGKLIFDGGGTKWIAELVKAESPFNSLFKAVREAGSIAGVCKYCIGAFGGKPEDVINAGLTLDGEFNEHPSLVRLIESGYQVITL